MVYGSLGRAGVYETQAMLRLLHAAGNATDGGAPLAEEARVEDARALLAALPDAHPLRRNRPIWSSEEVQGRMGLGVGAQGGPPQSSLLDDTPAPVA